MNLKGQANLMTIIVGAVFAILLSAILIYAVGFPVLDALNANVTTSGGGTNSTAVTPTTSGVTHTFAGGPHNQGGTLQITAWNSTSATATIRVDVGGIQIGTISPDSAANETFTFSNVSVAMLEQARPVVNYTNTTAPSSTIIASAVLAFSDTQFGDRIPQSQQGNFDTVLVLLGITVLIVALAAFIVITRVI